MISKNNLPNISVIIPCYNLGKYIEEAIDSVLKQTYKNFEIIVVDDGSTDSKTVKILKELKKSKTTVYFKENGGVSTARNFGIKKSKGKYICCLDSDDKYHPEFLEKCINLFENSTNDLGIVTTWTKVFGIINELWFSANYKPELLGFENALHTASMYKKSAWEECGGYNEKMSGYEDWDLWIGIVGEGYRWETISEELFLYRVREGSKVNTSNKIQDKLFEKIVVGRKKYFDKYYPKVLKQFKNNQIYLNTQIGKKDLEITNLNLLLEKKNILINLVDTSKFWKLRNLWVKIKSKLKKLFFN